VLIELVYSAVLSHVGRVRHTRRVLCCVLSLVMVFLLCCLYMFIIDVLLCRFSCSHIECCLSLVDINWLVLDVDEDTQPFWHGGDVGGCCVPVTSDSDVEQSVECMSV